jgi:hypothetical protein
VLWHEADFSIGFAVHPLLGVMRTLSKTTAVFGLTLIEERIRRRRSAASMRGQLGAPLEVYCYTRAPDARSLTSKSCLAYHQRAKRMVFVRRLHDVSPKQAPPP